MPAEAESPAGIIPTAYKYNYVKLGVAVGSLNPIFCAALRRDWVDGENLGLFCFVTKRSLY